MSQKLKCQECGHQEAVPMHCKQPMHIELVDGVEKLVCWMGPGCGVQDLPMHHEKPMKIEGSDISTHKVDSHNSTHPVDSQESVQAKIIEIPSDSLHVADLALTGMTCASCVNTIETGITKVEGVSNVAVNLMTEKAKVSYDPTKTNIEELIQSVENVGYGAKNLTSSFQTRRNSRRTTSCGR